MISELWKLGSLRRVYRMTPEELQDLQNRKLRAAMRYAYERVPLYRERFDGAGISPSAVRTVEDLAQIPQTTKQDLQNERADRIVAAGVDRDHCIIRQTNGSTGRPLRIYVTRQDQRIRSLTELRALMRLGMRFRDRLAAVGPVTTHRPRMHERLGFYSTYKVSGFAPPEQQLAQLAALQPTILWFYPSMMRALRRAANDDLRKYIQPRLLISSAEMLDKLLREQIRGDLEVDPYSAYGANETGRLSLECPAREGLHINIDHVVLESWADGRPAEPGETGVALVTTLNARGMPLVRYRLGDRIRILDKLCSCGSPLPLMDMPGGRESDVIALPSGRMVSPFAVTDVLREYMEILQFRIVQQGVDRLRLDIVTREGWPAEKLRQLESTTLEKLGEPMTVEAQQLGSLPEDGVKFRYFVPLGAPALEARQSPDEPL